MADINFGILDTQLPGRIAAIPQEAQKQQTANMLQAMQMQGVMNQNELSKYTLASAQRTDASQNAVNAALKGSIVDGKINYDLLTSNLAGGAGASKIPDFLKARSDEEKRTQEIEKTKGDIAKQAREAVDSELTLFTKNAFKVTDVLSLTNHLKAFYGNPLLGKIASKFKPFEQALNDDIKQISTPEGLRQWQAENANLTGKELTDLLLKRTPTELSKYVSERAAMLPGDPRIANWDAKIAELSTAPAAQRDIINRQGADRIKQGWGQLNVAQRNAATNEARLKLAQDAPKNGLTDPEDIERVAVAVASGRIPVDRLNSGTAKIYAGLLKTNPDLDFIKTSIEQAGAKASALSKARIAARQTLTDVDATYAENIARGNLPAATGINANKIMNEVVKLNPEYNSRDFGLQTAAEKEFNIGKNGNKTRSLNVAVSHLGTLDTAAAALNAGDIPALSQFSQAWQRETGKIGPTSFNAVKELVADEIVAAVVPNVGALADRKALKDTIMAKSSPAQIQGVIKEYKELMGGQLGGLEKQYNASTRKTDFRQRYLTPEAIAALTPGQKAPPSAAMNIPQAAINDLKAGIGTPAQFDEQFGAGAAARVTEDK